MLKSLSLCVLVSLFLLSCATDTKQSLEAETNVRLLSDTSYSLSDVNLPLKMNFPLDFLRDNELKMDYNHSFGLAEIRIGKKLDITISRDDLSLAQIKQDLHADQLFTYKFLESGEDQLFYQAVLPTGEEYYYHYAAVEVVEGDQYLIRTNPLGEFTKRDIELLIESVESLEPLKAKIASEE